MDLITNWEENQTLSAKGDKNELNSNNRPFSYSRKEPGSSVILYIFIHEIRSNGVRASIAIVHIRKFYKM